MNKLNYFIVAGIILFLFGCAKSPLSVQGKQDLLQTRVNSYVTALEANDLISLYDFSNPDYKKMVGLQQFVKMRNVNHKNISIETIDYNPETDRANVVLNSTMNAMGFDFKNFKIKQKWVFIDGNWYEDIKPKSMKGVMVQD